MVLINISKQKGVSWIFVNRSLVGPVVVQCPTGTFTAHHHGVAEVLLFLHPNLVVLVLLYQFGKPKTCLMTGECKSGEHQR